MKDVNTDYTDLSFVISDNEELDSDETKSVIITKEKIILIKKNQTIRIIHQETLEL